MERLRVVHYLNQFFAGIGGETKAGLPPEVRSGPVGAGLLLQAALKGAGEVVATVYCGDDYVSSDHEGALHRIVELVAKQEPAVVVAGPAFASGRYGIACGAVARAVEERLGIPALTAMSPDNPAVEVYRSHLIIMATGDSPAQTGEIMARLARLAVKRGRREILGTPEEEGYLPRGIRRNVLEPHTAAERVVNLLMAKLRGEPYRTEVPLPATESLVPAPPLSDLKAATIALVTSGGVVARGNPERIEARRASRWTRLPLVGKDALAAEEFECVHGGFDNALVAEDPHRVLPVDVMRELARERKIGRLHDYCYTTVGAGAPVERAKRFGREIGEELVGAGVHGVILTAT
jgi:glycine reductase